MLEDEPEIPAAVEHIWGWFLQLSATRGGGFGPAPLAYSEIEAWTRMTGDDPTPWELERIMELDRIYLNHMAERAKDKDKG